MAFDKHYKEQVKELMAANPAMTEDEAKAQAPLILEAREMLQKWEAGDKDVRALWEMMNQWVYNGFDISYRRMGVGFDKIYYESQTYLDGKAKVLEGLDKGVLVRDPDGSVWADLTDEGLDRHIGVYDSGHRHCQAALRRLSYRQDDLCRRQ